LQTWVVAKVITEVVAEITVEVFGGVLAKVAAEVFVIWLDQGVGNLVYYYMVVQAGLGFDVDTSTALYLIITVEVAAEVAAKGVAEIATEIIGRTELNFDCGSGDL
jgi:hypothetical protein